jgi:hypothetical protein
MQPAAVHLLSSLTRESRIDCSSLVQVNILQYPYMPSSFACNLVKYVGPRSGYHLHVSIHDPGRAYYLMEHLTRPRQHLVINP